MDLFEYRGGRLHCEQLPLHELAERFGTPLYVYSAGTLREHYQRVAGAFAAVDPLICYSVKCCPNLHICRLLARLGSGFDVVSGGELHRVLTIGADPARIVFAGVGKTDDELRQALRTRVGLINAESLSELARLAEIAEELRAQPRIAIRVNPDVDARTHQYTTTGTKANKFGLDVATTRQAFETYGRSGPLQLCGIHMHIGSPVYEPDAYVAAIDRGLELIDALRASGFAIDTFDVGGGFGAHYRGSESPPAQAYADAIVPRLVGRGLRIVLEPGRSIAANAGVLLTRVLHVKPAHDRTFVIVDAAMTELIRPALYQAYHFAWPVAADGFVPSHRGPEQSFGGLVNTDLVGPVCESGDFLAKGRALPPLARGDLVAVYSAGAYGMSMASQYNSRPRPAEVLVEGDAARVIRRRETVPDLIAAELD